MHLSSDELERRLRELEPGVLAELIVEMTRQHPYLEEIALTAIERDEVLGPDRVRRKMRRLIGADRPADQWTYTFGRDLEDLREQVAEAMNREEPRVAARTARGVLEEFVAAYDELAAHDRHGELSRLLEPFVEALGSVWSDLDDQVERDRALRTLYEVVREDIEWGGIIIRLEKTAASVLLELPREGRQQVMEWARADRARIRNEEAEGYGDREITAFLIELGGAELSEQELLRFCRESGLVRRGVEKLLALGREEEAAQLADRVSDVRLTTDLAPLFEEAGCEEVFADLLTARTDEGTPHARVLKWLIPYHRRLGESKQVLDYARSLYFRSPGRDGLRTYRESARVLNRWSEEKRRAIKRLEREGADRALVRLHLEEGEIGAAIEGLRELEEGESDRAPRSRWETPRVPNSLREEVARAAEAERPEAAAEIYGRWADAIVADKGRENYRYVARQLAEVRRRMDEEGEGAEPLEEAVRRLMDRHGRKRALRDELQKAGLISE